MDNDLEKMKSTHHTHEDNKDCVLVRKFGSSEVVGMKRGIDSSELMCELNKLVYWESGWCAITELRDLYSKIKHIPVAEVYEDNACRLNTICFNHFKQLLTNQGVERGYQTIDGTRRRVWKNIAPIDSDRG